MPYNLQTDSPQLPFAPDAVWPIASLFKDPRRGWMPQGTSVSA